MAPDGPMKPAISKRSSGRRKVEEPSLVMEATANRALQLGGLTQKAFLTIRSMILRRQLTGGEILAEDRLAEELDISKTPVREALLLLHSEGLIQKEPSRPFRVRHVSNKEYFQSMRMRELLEGEAIAAAIGNIAPALLDEVERDMLALKAAPDVPAENHWAADERLHDGIAAASGNEVMSDFIRRLRITTRLFELSGLPSRFRPDTEEHLQLVRVLRSGTADEARAAMKAHIRSLTNDVLTSMARM
jgi:DNA-binding GntR family transcriptional regulator